MNRLCAGQVGTQAPLREKPYSMAAPHLLYSCCGHTCSSAGARPTHRTVRSHRVIHARCAPAVAARVIVSSLKMLLWPQGCGLRGMASGVEPHGCGALFVCWPAAGALKRTRQQCCRSTHTAGQRGEERGAAADSCRLVLPRLHCTAVTSVLRLRWERRRGQQQRVCHHCHCCREDCCCCCCYCCRCSRHCCWSLAALPSPREPHQGSRCRRSKRAGSQC